MGQFRPQFVCSLCSLGNRACGGDSLRLSFLVNRKSVEGHLIVDVCPEVLKGLLPTSKAGWVEDGGAALDYLTGTRHLSPAGIVVYGQGLGANLAAELAEWHYAKIAAGLAGMVLDRPAADGASPIFADPRSRMVPARWLVKEDRKSVV